MSADKNEILFKRFGINYNNEEEIYKKGSVIYRQVSQTTPFTYTYQPSNPSQYQLEDVKSKQPAEEDPSPAQEGEVSKTQQEKLRKLRRKAQVVVDHVDIIKDEFWERRPWILSGKPGKLPSE